MDFRPGDKYISDVLKKHKVVALCYSSQLSLIQLD